MTGNEFRVEPAALAGHAGSVEEAAGQVASARGKAGAVAADTSAYGRLMSWLPPHFAQAQDEVIATLNDGERSLREAATALREAAETYERSDKAAARSYRNSIRR